MASSSPLSTGERSGESPSDQDGRVMYEVKQVFVYIPAEQSAARIELKLAGSVRVISKTPEVTELSWDPEELTYQDVSSLYANEADDWTIVDEDDVVSHVIIKEQPHSSSASYHHHSQHEQSKVLYPSLPVDDVEPIHVVGSSATSGLPHPKNKAGKKKQEPKITIDMNEAKFTAPTKQSPPISPESPVSFELSKLKYIKEGMAKGGGIQSLTFFLMDGKELPTLHFHDGGTSGLIQSLKRYLYFVRDGKDSRYLRVEESPFIVKTSHELTSPITKHIISRRADAHVRGVEGFLNSAVQEVSKRVRHSFRHSSDMLEERPKINLTKDAEEDEIQTITCHDLKGKESDRNKGLTPDPDMSLITDFQVISDLSRQLPSRPFKIPRIAPLGREEWEDYRQIDGRITEEKEKEFRARVFAGGIEPGLRREVWKYLLGYFKFNATDIERMETQKTRADQYETMKKQWQSFLPEQELRWRKWRELKHLVDKDVVRTDRELDMYHSLSSPRLNQLRDILNTYVVYHFDLGYVQGMSDLLAPILAVMDNECDAFWCFVGLMEMIGHYFEETQTEMRMRIKRLRALLSVLDSKFYQFLKDKDSGNLYFAFRWLLIDFKREFHYDDLMCIWEVLWTRHLSSDYALFIALAIIEQEKEKLGNKDFDFSDIIAHVNDLSKKLEYEPILLEAESICRQIAGVQNLPEELELLINYPLPEPHDFLNSKFT